MASPESSPYARSIVALVDDRWERNAAQVVLRYTDANDNWIDVTGAEAAAQVAAVAKGLIALRRRDHIGHTALMDVARLNGPPEAWHLGFMLGPRINAGGRIGRADRKSVV